MDFFCLVSLPLPTLPSTLCSLCAGVSLGPAEGLGHQQHQHEAVRQPHAHTDGRQAQVQAAVQEGGVGHAAVFPLLHLPARGESHVSPTPDVCYSFSLDDQQSAASGVRFKGRRTTTHTGAGAAATRPLLSARVWGRCLVTLVNPSGNDVNPHKQTQSRQFK